MPGVDTLAAPSVFNNSVALFKIPSSHLRTCTEPATTSTFTDNLVAKVRSLPKHVED